MTEKNSSRGLPVLRSRKQLVRVVDSWNLGVRLVSAAAFNRAMIRDIDCDLVPLLDEVSAVERQIRGSPVAAKNPDVYAESKKRLRGRYDVYNHLVQALEASREYLSGQGLESSAELFVVR
jgi:hypothetical protein